MTESAAEQLVEELRVDVDRRWAQADDAIWGWGAVELTRLDRLLNGPASTLGWAMFTDPRLASDVQQLARLALDTTLVRGDESGALQNAAGGKS